VKILKVCSTVVRQCDVRINRDFKPEVNIFIYIFFSEKNGKSKICLYFSNKTIFLLLEQIITDPARFLSVYMYTHTHTHTHTKYTHLTYTTFAAGQTRTSYNPYL